MVKTPKMRHSKSRREPVTIDLDAGEVSRVTEADGSARSGGSEDAAPSQPVENAATAASETTAPDDAAPGEGSIRAQEADYEPWEHDEAARAAAVDPASPVSEAAAHDFEPADAQPPQAEADEPAATPETGRAFDYSFDEATAKPTDGSSGSTGAAGTGKSGSAMPPPPSPSATTKRGGMNAVAAGLIGAIIALIGAGILQFAGVLGAPGSGSAGGSLDGVNTEIASLKTEFAALKNGDGGAASTKVDGLSAALDQVKADVAALKSAVESGGAGGDAGLAALSDKVKQIETAVAALGQGGNAAPVDLGPLNEKLAALDALVKSAGDTATAQEGRLATLEQSVSQLSAKVEAQAAQPKIAMAIAASALKAALDRGAPFSAELETFAAIAPDAPQIATLRAYAEKGVPTRAQIAAETDAAANAMVAAAEPLDDNAGFFDNLLSSAESLVKVRPIGAVQGAGVPETVARIEVAVNQGDYARALAEYDTLPDPVKAAGADFAGRLKARTEVETQVDALIAGAMKA